jgi:hypothetical protein
VDTSSEEEEKKTKEDMTVGELLEYEQRMEKYQ